MESRVQSVSLDAVPVKRNPCRSSRLQPAVPRERFARTGVERGEVSLVASVRPSLSGLRCQSARQIDPLLSLFVPGSEGAVITSMDDRTAVVSSASVEEQRSGPTWNPRARSQSTASAS